MSQPRILLSVDVEDWFQAENLKDAIGRKKWDGQEIRIVQSTQRVLDILDENNTKATFFVLGWITERFPQLIQQIHKKGHEIACHGYAHELIHNQTPQDFRKDLLKSKNIIEDCIGEKIIGYRAPCFSITDWAIDILIEEGFQYDSSFYDAVLHQRYGKIKNNSQGNKIWQVRPGFYEFSMSTLELGKIKLPWSGGYIRGMPYWLFIYGVKRIINKDRSYVFYFHPWEIDNLQPRLKNIKVNYRIRHYIGLKDMEKKLKKMLREFSFTSIREGLEKFRNSEVLIKGG